MCKTCQVESIEVEHAEPEEPELIQTDDNIKQVCKSMMNVLYYRLLLTSIMTNNT